MSTLEIHDEALGYACARKLGLRSWDMHKRVRGPKTPTRSFSRSITPNTLVKTPMIL